jgi:hypothetical protein
MDIWFVSFGACVWFLSTFKPGDAMNKIDLIIDALERTHKDVFVMKALAAARELRELKPVAWLHPDKKIDVIVPTSLAWFDKPIPLYAAPAKREWVGLTKDEKESVYKHADAENHQLSKVVSAVEWLLKDKNTTG